MTSPNWHNLSPEQTISHCQSSPRGLSQAVAEERLQQLGKNELPEQQSRSIWKIILGQFSDFMILVLLAAAVVSGLMGDPADTIAILVIIALNAVIGIVQELRAERAVAALRQMSAPAARVLRDGRLRTIAACALVPGDLVLLEAGNIVPADLRLLTVEQLEADESALTGESRAVSKTSATLEAADLPLGDRINLAFKSSIITRGKGTGMVVASGLQTEIGKIAELLQTSSDPATPLQIRLARFGRYLALSVLAICSIVFVAGLLQGQPWLLMLLTAVSLAVAAIPEALPAVIAISLALGAHKLIRQHTLVRNLPAVETLGSVTYICTDKTGTLTENKMKAERFFFHNSLETALPASTANTPLTALGQAMAISNDVEDRLQPPSGEPTELALYLAASAQGYHKAELDASLPRCGAIAFDSQRKQMTTLHHNADQLLALSKGAPEVLLPQCTQMLTHQGPVPCPQDTILEQANNLASEGYRVLALAQRNLPATAATPPYQAHAIEQDLTLLGLVALIDPPRAEASAAIQDCLHAGITPVMITGDHPGTALAIARRLGITDITGTEDNSEYLITGAQLEQLSDQQLAERIAAIRVYARVSPEQKLRIVKALQQRQEFVAMTGDGVNDAPALQNANIGVAMGKKGTDVARQAADMVLLDDNFASIVQAVKSGRRIFDNIRKFIKYTMTSNAGEIWTLFLAPLMGLPIPLLPIHILWINLVTDGLPGLAFTTEPAEKDLMRRPPRPPRESIFAHGMWQHIIWGGLLMGGLSIGIMAWAIAEQLPYWQTMVFTVLTLSQLFQALAVRGETTSLFSQGLLSNLPMLGAVLLTLLLQISIIYLPPFQAIFNTQPLPLAYLLLCVAVSAVMLLAVEIEKWFVRRGKLYGPA